MQEARTFNDMTILLLLTSFIRLFVLFFCTLVHSFAVLFHLFAWFSMLPVPDIHNLFFVALHNTTAVVAKQRKQKIVKFSVWVKRFAICVWFANKSPIRNIIIIVVKFKQFQWNRVIITIDPNHIFNWFRLQIESYRPKYRGSIWRPIFIMSKIIFRAVHGSNNFLGILTKIKLKILEEWAHWQTKKKKIFKKYRKWTETSQGNGKGFSKA